MTTHPGDESSRRRPTPTTPQSRRRPISTTPAADRAGYLGPQGTFSEEALLASARPGAVRPTPLDTIRDAVLAVQRQALPWAVVPIENSIEGSVTVTLDTLTGEAEDVTIVGEEVLPVRHCLVAHERLALDRLATIVSHPHVPGQCTRFLHGKLPSAQFTAATSTAEAVRIVAERKDPSWAAIGTRLAAEIYGCAILAEDVQDRADNQTRFVWLGRTGTPSPPLRTGQGEKKGKTSIVFWGAGADRAGWLVLCLDEFGRRQINLTKIESRPRREELGHYMFFVDLEGFRHEGAVAEALGGLRELCERVRVLGSYPAAS